MIVRNSSAPKENLPPVVQGLGQPQVAAKNNIHAPVSRLPALPQNQYKEFLRYGKEETQKTILQETVDRTVQKNLSRNVKSLAKKKAGNLGLGRNISTLQKLSLHRDRRVALRDAQRATGNALYDLNKLCNVAQRRICKRNWDQNDASKDKEVPALVKQQQENVKAATDPLLKVLDYHIETLESLARREEAAQADLQYLSYVKRVRNNIESALQRAEQADGNSYGISIGNRQAIRALSRHLRQLSDAWAANPLPPGLQNVRNVATLRKVGKPQIETLSGNDKKKIADSRRFSQISRPLSQAVRGGLTTLSKNTGLRSGCLMYDDRQALGKQVNDRDRMLSCAKVVITAHNRDFDTGLDSVHLPKNVDGSAVYQDAESYADYLLTLGNRDRAQFFDAVQSRVDEWKLGLGMGQEDLARASDTNNKALEYAKVVFEAAKAGEDLRRWKLPRNVCPLDDNGKFAIEDAQSYCQFLSQLSLSDQRMLFQVVDQQVAGWQKEYKTLVNKLKPKNIFQKAWSGIKNWFPLKKEARTATMMGAFSDEMSISVEEAEEAAGGGGHGGAETLPTSLLAAKTGLHTLAIVNNYDLVRRAQIERHHLKHKQEISKKKIERYENERPRMDRAKQYRSQVRLALYEKTGDVSVFSTYIEQNIGYTQMARHSALMVHDIMMKAEVFLKIAQGAGKAGFIGGAVAEYSEGLMGAKKAIDGTKIKLRMQNRIKEIKEEMKKPETRRDPEKMEALNFQLQTLEDLSEGQEVLFNTLSSMKGFGMGAAFTVLLAVGAATGGIGAAVLLATWAATQASLSGYQYAKNRNEIWKIDNTEDVVLGRCGDKRILDKLREEASKTGATNMQVALRWINKNKRENTRRPSSRKLLHDLKLETKAVRISDQEATEMASLQNTIRRYDKWITSPEIPVRDLPIYRERLKGFREKLKKKLEAHYAKIMQSETAKTLRDAYRMPQKDIAAIVDAPNDDEHDDFGVELISAYHNELLE